MNQTADLLVLSTPQQILEFWFGPDQQRESMRSLSYIKERMAIWFAGKSVVFDDTQRMNAGIVQQVGRAGANVPSQLGVEWDNPRGLLARVILLDQFSRCIYRGTAGAFQYDGTTAAIVKQLFIDGTIASDAYLPIERFFLGVAIQHAEDVELQRIGVQIASLVSAKDCPEDARDFFLNLKGYPHEHCEVIERFGRFPSRNDALGRISTEDEIDWLSSPECPAWAKSQQKKDNTLS